MAIKNFSQYLVEEEREVFFTFGRMNPPTIGHGKVMDVLSQKSGKADYKVFVSQSQNSKKDPLSYSDKIKHLRKMFPKHGRNVMVNKKVKTAFDAVSSLYDQGYKNVTMIVGADRVREFDVLLKKYNGVKGRHGFYNFKNINVVSAGARDPDAEGGEGRSASKQRMNAKNNDFVSFSQGVSKSMSNSDARKLFNDVRSGMGLKETTEFRNHVALSPLSEEREAFVKGELFSVGDVVVIKESEEIGTVTQLGANFVIVEANGREYRKWLHAVEKIDEDCWDGYKQVGLKKKGNKMVPNCVPEVKEKKMSAAQLKKREEIAKAIEKENPDMPMDKKMAIATAQAMKVAEDLDVKAIGFDKWLSILERQDPDIKDREGTQPARYHKGLKKSTKVKRDAHFKKHGKKSDDDASAYKPAPGDKTAKTKPSKYTKAYNDMYGEANGAGEEGTKDLLKKYKKDTPMEKTIEEDSFADKSKKSGISVATLKKVYNRGVAAWKTGHRPGTTPSQWGHARVNAFIVKKKKGNLNHDKDLA